MVYNGPAGQEITYYVTPLYEIMYAGGLSTNRHYIYAGGRPVVEVSTYNGVVTVRSLLVDHQGSISSVVTDSTGASLVSESFTAYGNRREASTWTGAPTSGELTTMNGVTRQGYTFQTVLGSMGLNHMNGRIEDSVTGRFLSPDPRGTIRGNTQSWNRYSYVNNNPLSFTDPTGFGSCNLEEVSGCTIGEKAAHLGNVDGAELPSSIGGYDLGDGSSSSTVFSEFEAAGFTNLAGDTWNSNGPTHDPRNFASPGGTVATVLPDETAAANAGADTAQSIRGTFNDPNLFSVEEFINGAAYFDNTQSSLSTVSVPALSGSYLAPAAFANALSDVSGWIGSAANVAEFASPLTAEAAHLIGLTTFGLETSADFTSARFGGISQAEAYTNVAVGIIGIAGAPLTMPGAVQYFMGNQLYKAVYGNSQAGWDALGSAFDAMSRSGLGP